MLFIPHIRINLPPTTSCVDAVGGQADEVVAAGLEATAELAEKERRSDGYIEGFGVGVLGWIGRDRDTAINVRLQIGVDALTFVAHNE